MSYCGLVVASHGRHRIAPTFACPTAREDSLAARSGELQLERGADRTDWLAFEVRDGAGELLAQGAESPVIG